MNTAGRLEDVIVKNEYQIFKELASIKKTQTDSLSIGTVKSWVREDDGVNVTQIPGKDGPAWADVISKTIVDKDTGEIVEDAQPVTGASKGAIFRKLGGPHNLRTIFQYRTLGKIKDVIAFSFFSCFLF